MAGVTWSCSKVPVRRSFTIETAVMSVVRNVSTKPKVPATMNGVPSSVGLKSARVTTVDARAAPSAPAAPSAAAARASLAAIRPAGSASALPASTVSAPS